MKRLKELMERLKELFEELFVLFLIFGLPILAILVCLAFYWLIATSDLPGWFKFALLSK